MQLNFENTEERIQAACRILFEDCESKSSLPESLIITAVIDDSAEACLSYDGKIRVRAPELVIILKLLSKSLAKITESNKSFELFETAKFSERAVLLDCSRNAVYRVETVKELLKQMAKLGLNQLYLYLEDTYVVVQEPLFGAYRGRYTKPEIDEIKQQADALGIELIPAIQTLAHLRTFLRWPEARSLRDTDDILLVGSEQVSKFVRNCLSSIKTLFATNRVHLGMDEAFALGLGKFLKANGYKQPFAIMREHLLLLREICSEFGLEAEIWSDMFLRAKSSSGDYYDLPEGTSLAEFSGQVAGLKLFYWDYYHEAFEDYRKNLEIHESLGADLSFATGAWTWNGLAPNYQRAFITMDAGLEIAAERGIEQVMLTAWFDNGAETPLWSILPSLAYFSAKCFVCSDFAEDLFLLTRIEAEKWLLLAQLDNCPGTMTGNPTSDNPAKFLLYQDPLLGIFDGMIEGLELNNFYGDLAKKLESVSASVQPNAARPDLLGLFNYFSKLAAVLSVKAELGLKLRRAYASGERAELSKLVGQIDSLLSLVSELHELRTKLWFVDAKPQGYEVLDIRLAGVVARLRSARERVNCYLANELEDLLELREPLVQYNHQATEEHRLCMAGFWDEQVSASNICGI